MQTTTSSADISYRHDLGDGLLMRWSTADDTENIAELTAQVFRNKADEPPNEFTGNAVRRLMRGDHPLMGPGDYAIVEDTRKQGNPVVAGICLLRYQWRYEGIPFPVGRPEIVATDPAYRNRGLIRRLFSMIHARSKAEGHLVQAITGIAHFYRQFGYEYALDLGGKRTTYLSLIPRLKEGETEPFTLRDATVEDIPLISQFYYRWQSKGMVWTEAPDEYWHYLLESWKANPERDRTDVLKMIVDNQGNVKGYVHLPTLRWSRELGVLGLGIAPETNLQAILPSLLRALQQYGAQVPTRRPDTDPFSEIGFWLGRSHPVYDALGEGLAPSQEPPYAWYVRVADVPAFLRHIAPALEKRLADSAFANYSGELKFDFYRSGLRLVFENGKLTTAEHWRMPLYEGNPSAGFPPLVFLQLLFGHRSLDELRHAFPDVWANNEAAPVLKILFPARPSLPIPFLN